ncbi:hypothetical protein [Helicobacter pylori]|uniref:hypothetical protein n=1 Tax=Helicobacter pylori TaxID=210 RepID=UPI0015E82AF4|nr:hypothetical protein [Helicobacter pylori]
MGAVGLVGVGVGLGVGLAGLALAIACFNPSCSALKVFSSFCKVCSSCCSLSCAFLKAGFQECTR